MFVKNRKLIIGVDQEVVSRLAEVDMIVADLERANSRVAAVERRNVGYQNFCVIRLTKRIL